MTTEAMPSDPVYSRCLEIARETAREAGYAIGLHGSMKRDLDLIACPWIDNADPAKKLVQKIATAIRDDLGYGWLADRQPDGKWPSPAFKPHGRIAYSIMLRNNQYIDISVMMPTSSAPTEQVN